MPLKKQAITINFAQGLDLKTDPNQVQPGKFLNLENTIFLKGGLLQKRNGYKRLPDLPDNSFTNLTTFNGNLTALGSRLNALSISDTQWINTGKIQPLQLSTLPLIRNNVSQSQPDTAISANGLICTVYATQDPANLANKLYMYAVADVITGQNVRPPTLIPNAAPNASPRVFLFGAYFVIVFNGLGAPQRLQFFGISIFNNFITTALTNVDTTGFVAATTVAWDGVVVGANLYLAYNGSGGVRMAVISQALHVRFVKIVDPNNAGTIFSITPDLTAANDTVWVSYFDAASNAGWALAVSNILDYIVAVTPIITNELVFSITSQAMNGVMTFIYHRRDTSIDPLAKLPLFIKVNTVTQQTGVNLPGLLGTARQILRSTGLASKAFQLDGVIYVLIEYFSLYQQTYFLINTKGDLTKGQVPDIIAKLAYGNAGMTGAPSGLPSVSVVGNLVQISYLIKLNIQSVNKNTNVPAGSQTAGVFSQVGINLVKFIFNVNDIISSEIGNNLNMSGGITWAYDGYSCVEQGFHVYPDNIQLINNTVSGSLMTPQIYFYEVTYEWTDNQGNAFRSAPSIPVSINLVAPDNSVTIKIPPLELTYKIANPVKIVIYRWSTAQPSYYQVTSITTPLLNDITQDVISFVDKSSDSLILGNNLIYTTGGVLENIGPPSFQTVFLFDDRLWGIVSEDRNLLWFSKQVLEDTPVEMSDLQTIYVAPNIGAQGSTGILACGAAMDDKLILFKPTAINYVGGTGPDATGSNNQYTAPIFVTATIGCSNQDSIVFQPQGLMFEFTSKAGNQIWLLGRDLSTQYIGGPVQELTKNAVVESALNIPGTNQVRFTMDSGLTLMYDYFYGQWGAFTNIPAISSDIYEGVHSYLNKYGQVFLESPGSYLDGADPVLVSLTTSWFNLAGLKGYERAYRFYLLGSYISPHKLNLQIAYDYNPNSLQYTQITPENFAPNYGIDTPYGQGTPYGGPGNLEQWRVFLTNQRCESFQITISEQYDPRFETPAGAGLTLSGITCILGIKGPAIPMRADRSVG